MKKEQSKIHMSSGMDKMDSYMVPVDNFFHDDYYVGGRTSRVHKATAYGYRDTGPGFNLGIQSRAFKATGEGYMIDSCGSVVGKSDEY